MAWGRAAAAGIGAIAVAAAAAMILANQPPEVSEPAVAARLEAGAG